MTDCILKLTAPALRNTLYSNELLARISTNSQSL